MEYNNNKNRKPSLEDDGEVSSIPTDKSSGEEQHAGRAADGRHKGRFSSSFFFFYLFVPPSSSRSSTEQKIRKKRRKFDRHLSRTTGRRAPNYTHPIQNKAYENNK